MKNEIRNAIRFISAFVALMVGDKVTVRWNERAGLSPDGQIYLPMPKTGEAAEVALLTRLAVHEAGHKIHTDTGYDTRLTEEEIAIFNALEDPRMEAMQAHRFPGAPVILSRGLDELLACIQERMDGDAPFEGVRVLQLDLVLRGSLAVAPNRSLQERAPKILASLAGAISNHERAALDVAIEALPTMRSSLDAENVARELLARVRTAPPPEDEQPDSNVPDQQDENVGQDAGSAADEKSESDEAQEADEGEGNTPGPAEPSKGGEPEQAAGPSSAPSGSGDQQAPSGTTASEDSNASASQESQPSAGDCSAGEAPHVQGGPAPVAGSETEPAPGAAPADLGEMLREALLARYGNAGQDDGEVVAPEDATAEQLGRLAALFSNTDPDTSLEELIDACCETLQPVENVSHQQARADSISEVAAAASYSLAADGGVASTMLDIRLQGVQSRLVTVLQRELQDTRRRPTRPAHAGGRVAPTRFWRLKAVGDTRIFNVRRNTPGIDAAATVLVDKSGSTARTLQSAAEVALAFSLAMQRLGNVRTSVTTFPGDSQITEVLQMFGESPRACVRKCADLVAGGGTPLGAAMVIEMARLLDQRRLKNLLVVVTDDKPGDPDVVLQAMLHARARGIDVVGVAIGCDIRRYIPRSISIGSTADLPDALSRLFREDLSATLAA
jgi:hypothetical protein